jgi:hypothetical protein
MVLNRFFAWVVAVAVMSSNGLLIFPQEFVARRVLRLALELVDHNANDGRRSAATIAGDGASQGFEDRAVLQGERHQDRAIPGDRLDILTRLSAGDKYLAERSIIVISRGHSIVERHASVIDAEAFRMPA